MTASALFTPLTLPNGVVIPNRIGKAAMEENMADADQAPSAALLRLYRAWAGGGAGLLISGNVMVDGRAMTGPGGVVLEDAAHLDRFRAWAQAGRAGGAQFWLQINHPGRQMPGNLGQATWAPSAVPLALGGCQALGGPRAGASQGARRGADEAVGWIPQRVGNDGWHPESPRPGGFDRQGPCCGVAGAGRTASPAARRRLASGPLAAERGPSQSPTAS